MVQSSSEKQFVSTDGKQQNTNCLDSPVTNTIVSFSKFSEIFSFIATFLGIYSVLGSLMLKYASYGSYLYFDFDMNYFDGSSPAIFSFAFALFLSTSIIAVTLGVLGYIIIRYIEDRIKFKKTKWRSSIIIAVYLLISIIVSLILTMVFNWILPPDHLSILICSFSVTICITTIVVLNAALVKITSVNILISLIASLVIVIFVVTGIIINTEYDEAESKREFAMIIDNKQIYVVISHNEDNYSAYEANIDEKSGILNIYIDKHKFFNIDSTPTTLVKFNDIKRWTSSAITYNDFYNQYKDQLDQTDSSIN